MRCGPRRFRRIDRTTQRIDARRLAEHPARARLAHRPLQRRRGARGKDEDRRHLRTALAQAPDQADAVVATARKVRDAVEALAFDLDVLAEFGNEDE